MLELEAYLRQQSSSCGGMAVGHDANSHAEAAADAHHLALDMEFGFDESGVSSAAATGVGRQWPCKAAR